jgi:MFS family permease
MPVYVRDGLGLPKIVGFVGASFLLAEALLNGPTGILADRYGRRLLMVIGPCFPFHLCLYRLLRVPESGSGQAVAIGFLLTLRFLDGAGAAALWPRCLRVYRGPGARKAAIDGDGPAECLYMIGLAIGPLVGGLLNDTIAARFDLAKDNPLRYAPSFGFAAVAFLIAAIVAFVAIPSRQSLRNTFRTRTLSITRTGGRSLWPP